MWIHVTLCSCEYHAHIRFFIMHLNKNAPHIICSHCFLYFLYVLAAEKLFTAQSHTDKLSHINFYQFYQSINIITHIKNLSVGQWIA